MGIIARQSIKGTIVTYLGVAIGFITTFFVLTRFLSAEEIGLARVLVDAATLFIGLAQLGTSSSIIRFYPYFKDKEQGDHGFFFWTLCVPFIGFLLFSLIYWACSVPLCQWFSEKSPLFVDYYYMVLPIAFFMLYQTIFETNANVLMRIVVPRAVREVFVRIGMLVIYLLYAFRILSMDGFVIAISLVYALATLINIVYLWYEGRISLRVDWAFLRANKQVVRNYLLYTAFLVISAVAAVLTPTLSSFFITAKMGLNYTGIFAIATYISVMVSIPYRSVTAIASPQLSQTIKDKDTQGTSTLMKQCSNNLLLIGGFILLTIWINIDLIFDILPNGETYRVAKYVILILSLTQLILSTFNITVSALNYSKFYAFSLLLSLLLTVSAIWLNNFLIPQMGMEGAAWSNLLSYTCYFVGVIAILGLTSKVHPFSWNQVKIVALLLVVFALNYVWVTFFPIDNIWLSSIVRSFVLLGLGVLSAWKMHLSPEVYEVFRSIFISRH